MKRLWCRLLLFVNFVLFCSAGTLRYCTPNGTRSERDACERFNREKQDVLCVMAEARMDCYNMLKDGTADFMAADPEELTLILEDKSDMMVTHQLKKFEKSPQEAVEMVVIVRHTSGESYYSTKGKNLCYLGFENNYYTSYFENWLFAQNCNPERSILENRLSALSEHFGSACVAGTWSLDPRLDGELKSKYSNLCALCQNPRICSNNDLYYGMQGALSCLTHQFGDIAWVNRIEAYRVLSRLAYHNYYFLCRDGQLIEMTLNNMNNTCIWIVDPPPVIIANSGIAKVVLDKITDQNRSKFDNLIHSAFIFSHMSKLEKPHRVNKYIERFTSYMPATKRKSQYSMSSDCRPVRTFSWCVSTNLEARKCRMLQKVADVQGVRPVFTCIQLNSRDECVRKVASGKYDVFVAKPDEIVKARSLGAKTIIDIMANEIDDANNVAAIVKRKSQYNSFIDLKGANACFTSRESIGWNSFLSYLSKNQSTYKMDCTDLKTVSNFFNDSCVLGLDEESPKNLRSICDHLDPKLDPNERTFQCLMNGTGDVAFVNVMAARRYALRNKILNVEYKLLCPNVDGTNSCYLGKESLGSIVVSKKLTSVKETDIYLAILKLDRYFGKKSQEFEMYGPFEGNLSVIFPNGTVKLERATPGSYREDLSFSSRCLSSPNASNRIGFQVPVVFVVYYILFIYVM